MGILECANITEKLVRAMLTLSQVHIAALYERLIPTTYSRAISNHIKLLRGWCKYLDWCQQFTMVRIGKQNKELREIKNKN